MSMPSSARNAPRRSASSSEEATRARHSKLISRACRQIEQSETPPDLDALAAGAGLSRFHFHRLFRQVTGLTPRAYAQARRAQRVQAQLAGSATVTEALHAAGYGSSSRFYAAAAGELGMPPRDFARKGEGQRIRFGVGQSTLGAVLVAATERGVCSILLGDDPAQLVRDLEDRFAAAELIGADARFEQWMAQVVGFIEAPGIGLDLPLDVQGTAFQRRVWEALQRIPCGQTLSYTELADAIGQPGASRAVAGACAANPIALAIPCHRVVRRGGALSGYRWGVERKRQLLERERPQAGEEPQLKSKSMPSGTATS